MIRQRVDSCLDDLTVVKIVTRRFSIHRRSLDWLFGKSRIGSDLSPFPYRTRMTRRSALTQVVSSPAVRSRKRGLSPTRTTPWRLSKRTKPQETTPVTTNTTPKKSQYFEPELEDPEPNTEADDESSDYEGEETSAVSSPRASEDEEDDGYSEEDLPSRRSAGRKKDGKSSASGRGQELWRPGVKTGLGPGKQVLIKIPKAREAGKIPYRDDTIHPNTLLFLRDLADNNDREWLKSKLRFDLLFCRYSLCRLQSW